MPPEEACPVIAAIHDRRSQDESERGPAPASRPSSAWSLEEAASRGYTFTATGTSQRIDVSAVNVG